MFLAPVLWFLWSSPNMQVFYLFFYFSMLPSFPQCGFNWKISNFAKLDGFNLSLFTWSIHRGIEFSIVLHYSKCVALTENKGSCNHQSAARQEWPETLHNNELFDLHWNSSVCVIIFPSDAYSHTWLLWLQTWSALFVCMSDRVGGKYIRIASVWAFVVELESLVQRYR